MGGQRVAFRRESLDRGAARRDLMTPLVSFRNVSCRLGAQAALLEPACRPPARFPARSPRAVSGGQGQPVGVARALAADPPILLFDEPFGALDPVTRVELQRQFLALRREIGKTAIFVTHDVREALLVATRIALLHDGRLDVLATPAEFLRAPGEEVRAFLACLDTQVTPA